MRERVSNSKMRIGRQLGLLPVILFTLAISACTTVPLDPPPQRPGPMTPQPQPPVQSDPGTIDPNPTPDQTGSVDPQNIPEDAEPFFNNRTGLTLPHMAGRDVKRLALLLPFSAESTGLRAQANSMFQAAELALFQRPDADVILTVLDTQGTADGARTAARAALQQGADIILGPIIAGNVAAASDEAARNGVPLLAFSNDQSVAARGRYLLSFPPEAEVERIVAYAATQGIQNFAYFGPENAYGRRVLRAYEQAVARVGGQVTASETYRGSDISVMQEPARRLAEYHADGRRAGAALDRDVFEAVLMPEAGTALRSLAPLLPFYGVDPERVLFMGTSRWDDRETAREPALRGGVFAASDKTPRDAFLSAYEQAYGDDPESLASLAYDAVQLGALAAEGDPRGRIDRIESTIGFYGTDGYLRFGPDGRPERGLAVYQIIDGRFRVVDPAPRGPASQS
jgi:ABC-type branched-subunit amino acid transport system substrate-binding protein